MLLALLAFTVSQTATGEEPVALQYYVTDSQGILSQSDVTDLEDLLFAIQNQTSAEFAVDIVNTTAPLSIEQFAVRTFEMSQLGQKGVDNGVLLVVAVEDHRWKIEVGYGLEGVLNDAKVGNIGRTYLEPSFESGDYGDGIYNAMYAMGVEVAGSDLAKPADFPIPGIPLNSWQLGVAIVVVIILFVVTRGGIFLWVFGLFRKGGGGRSGGGGAGGDW